MQEIKISSEIATMFITSVLVVFAAIKDTPVWKYVRRWVTVISLAMGIAASFLIMPAETPIVVVIMSGVLLGATPTGIYEAVRKKEDIPKK